jgi:hypothetical protein
MTAVSTTRARWSIRYGTARKTGCGPPHVRWAILGHEEETVAAGYGEIYGGLPSREV